MASRRLERVAARVQEELGRLLLREARDERLSSVSVTGVRMTPDLQIAHIHYVIIGEKADAAASRGEIEYVLDKANAFLRTALAERLDLRRAPELKFHYDESLERGARIEALLTELREAGEMGDVEPEEDDADETSTTSEPWPGTT